MDIRTLTLVDIESYQSLLHRAYQPILALGIHFSASTVSKSEIEQHLCASSRAYKVDRGEYFTKAT